MENQKNIRKNGWKWFRWWIKKRARKNEVGKIRIRKNNEEKYGVDL